jgi:hypothetical protein
VVSEDGNWPAEVRPLDVDGVAAVTVGTILWAVALVVLLVLRDTLEQSGSGWWIWVAAAGFGLGIPGLVYTTRRRAAYRKASASGTDSTGAVVGGPDGTTDGEGAL